MKRLRTVIVLTIIFAFCYVGARCLENSNEAEQKYPFQVHFIDVGEADSSLIVFPGGKTMLIDGGDIENGAAVCDYIKAQGIKRLDYVVGTHPHSDHIGGLPKVIESFDIGKVYMPKKVHTSGVFIELLETIKKKNLKIQTARLGVSIFKDGDLSAEIIAPCGKSYSNLNNYSAVIRIKYKNRAFLFTGDAENRALAEITSIASADVLKVAHHGSSTSDSAAFLKKVKPKIAVISVGKNNKYGHPNKSTLKNLKSVGAKIYRTDVSGTIVIGSDGSVCRVISEEKK